MISSDSPDFTNTPVSNKRPGFGYKPVDLAADPVASIVTPFYNTGKIFLETVQCILNQSLQQWEWIIVNDGSRDPYSLEMLDSFRNFDPRIKVIDLVTNQGPSSARNVGFQAARSEYIVQLDSDDLIEPTAMEIWRWCLESFPEYGFVNGYSVGFGAQQYLWTSGFHREQGFLEKNQVAITSMIRRQVHQSVQGYSPEIKNGFEDWNFWLKCAANGFWGYTIQEFQCWYRRRTDHSDHWKDWNNQEKYKTKLRLSYPQLWNGSFPKTFVDHPQPHASIPDSLPWQNHLQKTQKRLLMIVPWLEMGGADRFNLDLINQLKRFDWQTTVVTTLQGRNAWLSEFSALTPDLFILPHFLKPIDFPRFLRYIIESRQIDAVLITNSELGYMLLPYLRHHLPDLPFLDFCHMEEEYYKNGGYPRLTVEYQEHLCRNIVSSQHLRNWMINRGADAEKIEVCYTNIDLSYWQNDPEVCKRIRKSQKITDSTVVILYAARLCSQKQPFVLLRTIEKLKEQNLDFIALIAGSGEDAPAMREFIEVHDLLYHARMLGAVSNEMIGQLMKSSDIFFLPSDMEGIALTLYEAMASQIPVVGADVGGQRELVTPECGYLIPKSSPENEVDQYTKILSTLIKDPHLRRSMGISGRKRLENNFELRQMGDQFIKILTDVIQPATVPQISVSRGTGLLAAAYAIEYRRLNSEFEEYSKIQKNVTEFYSDQMQAVGEVLIAGKKIDPAILLSNMLETGKTIKNPNIMIHAYYEIGKINEVLGNLGDASKYLSISLGLAKKLQNQKMIDEVEPVLQRVLENSSASNNIKKLGNPDTPLVSIIIPTLNRRSQLNQAIASIIAQTYKNIEVIVINDGGENVHDVIAKYSGLVPIRYIEHEHNQGTGCARNSGLRIASGNFVAFLDDDDCYYPEHISSLIQQFKKNQDCAAVYSDAYEINKRMINGKIETSDRRIVHSTNFSQQQLQIRNYIPILCLLIRRDAIKKAGEFDSNLPALEDWEWLIRLAKVGPFSHLSKVTAEYTAFEGRSRNWLSVDIMKNLYLSIYTRTIGTTTKETIIEQAKLYAAITGGNLVKDMGVDLDQTFDIVQPHPVPVELSHPRHTPQELLSILLESQDLGSALKQYEDEIDLDLITLVQECAHDALSSGQTELMDGLSGLADYLQDVINCRKLVVKENNVEMVNQKIPSGELRLSRRHQKKKHH